MSKQKQNYINHVALVLDGSSSMKWLRAQVVKVADGLIEHMARRSKELDQETRVTVYVFAETVECVFYDMDVLRLPSLEQHYNPWGNTALIDATLKSQDDLALTPEIYGDHAFLTYVLTDGEENRSTKRSWDLQARLSALPDHWTVAALVPNQMGKHEAKKCGFHPDNIAIWDTTTVRGLEEAGETIRRATETFMTNRASGIRGSRAVFSTSADAVNKDTIQAAGLGALHPSAYKLLPVSRAVQIRDWVVECGLPYKIGHAYYQLSKTESIQPQKLIAVVDKKTGSVFTGPQARDLIGLPPMEVRVKPEHNREYDIFVQSTSVNRKLVPNTRLLVLT